MNTKLILDRLTQLRGRTYHNSTEFGNDCADFIDSFEDDIRKALAFYERFQEALPVLESIANAPEEFDHDLVFDETEGGGTGMWGYYGLITDYLSPADILIRFKRGDDEEGTKTIALANEVVKRWNARDTISKLIKEVG